MWPVPWAAHIIEHELARGMAEAAGSQLIQFIRMQRAYAAANSGARNGL